MPKFLVKIALPLQFEVEADSASDAWKKAEIRADCILDWIEPVSDPSEPYFEQRMPAFEHRLCQPITNATMPSDAT